MIKSIARKIGKKARKILGLRGSSKPDIWPDEQTLLLWAALEALNARISIPNGVLISKVRSVYEEFDLQGGAARNYLASAVPLMCRNNDLRALAEWKDLTFLADPGNSRDAWALSLAIPIQAISGKHEAAASLMTELSGSCSTGWLNTECIRFSIEHVQREGSSTAAQSIHEAFFGLLDAFKGEWHSRLHDAELTKAMWTIVAGAADFGSAHQERAERAAIRHYGLSPTFWEQASLLKLPANSLLAQANGNWSQLQGLCNTGSHSAEKTSSFITALGWFHDKGNPEAPMYMREFVFNHLKYRQESATAEERDLIAQWMRKEPEIAQCLDTSSIWPTYQVPAQNRLDLLTSKDQAAKLLKEEIFVVSVVRNEMILLPHFLDHYRGMGIKAFVIADNMSDDGTREYLLSQTDVVLYQAGAEYRESCYGVAWQQAILGNHCLGKWVVIADADEFLIYPGRENTPLPEFLAGLGSNDANAALAYMVDMYPEGSLAQADFKQVPPFIAAPWYDSAPLIDWRLGSGQFSNARSSYLSSLRHRLADNPPPNSCVSQKVALVRYCTWMRFSAGLHYAANVRLAENCGIFAHFKYHAAFAEKVREEVGRKQHYDDAKEYRQYLQTLENLNSGFAEAGVSAKGLAGLCETISRLHHS